MDVYKLTPNEIIESLTEAGIDFYTLATDTFSHIRPGDTYPIPIADLYIAQSLHKMGIQIPNDYNVNTLPADTFVQLAKTYYLPEEDTPENRKRATRITRIILDFNNGKPLNKIQILPVVFTRAKQYGDFSWMITRPEYADTLFIFNDNEEQFKYFLECLRTGTWTRNACDPGGGNSAIRPYQCETPPKAAGIPTGSNGRGYQDITTAKPNIDYSIQYIRTLLNSGRYKRVAYSAAADGRTLGTSIFSPSADIKEYIVKSIENLAL